MSNTVNTNSLERQKREKTEREKVRVLENLKGQAVTLQETAVSYLFSSALSQKEKDSSHRLLIGTN